MIFNIRITFLLLILLTQLPGRVSAAIPIRPDSSVLELRLPDSASVAAYGNQKAFRYQDSRGDAYLTQALPFWLRDLFNRLLQFIFSGSSELVLILLLTLIITTAILKINNIDPIALIRKKSRLLPDPYETMPAGSSMPDFQTLIRQAENESDFRLAIRYHYLQTLRMLAATGKIQLKEEKTNRDYLSELGGGNFRDSFSELIYGFEVIWYGEFLPDNVLYSRLVEAFNDFNSQLRA